MSYVHEGETTTAYLLSQHTRDEALQRLRRNYEELIIRYGSIAGALVGIASILDIPEVGAREGMHPEVVKLLLEASRRL